MKKIIFLFLILAISCSTNNVENEVQKDNYNLEHKNHNNQSHSDHNHMKHDKVETNFENMSIDFDITKDDMSGVNIEIFTTDFEFSPKNVNQKHIDGEGHAHLYIDGEKWGRIYGKHIHVGGISSGNHIFLITLNTNLHDEYSINGKGIKKSIDFNY